MVRDAYKLRKLKSAREYFAAWILAKKCAYMMCVNSVVYVCVCVSDWSYLDELYICIMGVIAF